MVIPVFTLNFFFLNFFFQISAEDSLPKYICNDCIDTLRVALIFKKTCESSDRKFKQILNPMGKHFILVIMYYN